MNREQLETRLAELKRVFDPYYEYSDDGSVYRKHLYISLEIREIENKLKELSAN